MVLHIDCNSFFASCEVVFRPDLVGKPVVVANCNEAGGGIILALTKESKTLGLKRGQPVFKVKEILNKNNVSVFPADHTKYVEISQRLMHVVREQDIVLNFKQYSVDEFFGELPLDDPEELRHYALKIKSHIEQCVGIPVSCGISSTYTLAKVATWYAKHFAGYEGICVLPEDKVRVALNGLHISEVWGIGRRTAPKLTTKGIETALQFYEKQAYEVKRLLNINGVRTWQELHGTPSISLEGPERQKSIMHSRTFAYTTADLGKLQRYVADYAVAAARKLREQHSVCKAVSVFISTNPHRDDLEQYDNYATVRLNVATADSIVIAKAADKALVEIFRNGYQYKRAGVLLGDIMGDEAVQLDMFSEESNKIGKSKKLMATLDAITNKYGMNSVKLAAQELERPGKDLANFQPKSNPMSNINDVIKVK